MAMQLGALRAALAEAGARDATSQKAADELAGYNRKFLNVRTDMADVKGELKLVKSMTSAIFAGVIVIILRLLIR